MVRIKKKSEDLSAGLLKVMGGGNAGINVMVKNSSDDEQGDFCVL